MAASKYHTRNLNEVSLKRKVLKIQEELAKIKDDFDDVEEYFKSSCQPAFRAAQDQLRRLLNKSNYATEDSNLLKYLGSLVQVCGAAETLLAGILFFTSGPFGAMVVAGGISGFIGLALKYKASTIRSSADKSISRDIDQTQRSMDEMLAVLREKCQNISSRYEGIVEMLEELRDFEGFEAYTREILGKDTFSSLQQFLENRKSFDFRANFERATNQHSSKESFLSKGWSFLKRLASPFGSVFRKVGSAIAGVATKLGVDKYALNFCQLIWKGWNLIKNTSKAFAKTLKVNPIFLFLEAGVNGICGVCGIYETVKALFKDKNETARAQAIQSLMGHLEGESAALADLLDELQPIRGQYDALCRDLEFLDDLIN